MLATGTFSDIFSNLDLWRGVGRFLIDAFLVYALLMIVLSVAGHPPKAWPFSGLFSRTQAADAGRVPPDPKHASHNSAPSRAAVATTEQHREYLDQLSTALKYQGSTVVLIVFAVILLGFQRVLAGPEVATILSGIAGFVLGQAKSSAPPAPPASGTGGSGGGAADRATDAHPDTGGGSGGSAPSAPLQAAIPPNP